MKDFEIVIISAVAENNIIGKNGDLPWHIPEDLKHFKALTTNHPVIMGANTANSLKKALPNRLNIALHPDEYQREGFYHFHSLEEVLEAIKNKGFEEDIDYSKIYIIGGGMLYKYAMDFADCLEITHVKKSVDGDVKFPDIDLNIWKEEKREEHDDFDFVTYVRND